MMKWIDGRKSYLGCIAIGIAGLVQWSEWGKSLDPSAWVAVYSMIGTFTGASIRHAIAKGK